MDDATIELLRATLRRAFSTLDPVDIQRTLTELGWDDVIADDEARATSLLFEEQGRALATSNMLDAVVSRAAGVDESISRVLYPAPRLDTPAQSRQDRHIVSGLTIGPVATGERLLTLLNRPRGSALSIVVIPPEAVATAVNGVDPSAGWFFVRTQVESVEVLPSTTDTEAAWMHAMAAAHRALGSELLGLSRGVLALAVRHVTDRTQFGRPIGSFQAVRHRLAEAYAWIEGTEALVAAAWASRCPSSAATVKAHAGRTHALVTRHAMQVCGAMGLTWEHDLHRYVRRGFLLDSILGSSDELAERIAGDLLGVYSGM